MSESPPPSFTTEELTYLHDYLFFGPSKLWTDYDDAIYIKIIEKLDLWRFPL